MDAHATATMENLSTLAEISEALDDLAIVHSLIDDALTVTMAVNEDDQDLQFASVLTVDDRNHLVITCQYCLLNAIADPDAS